MSSVAPNHKHNIFTEIKLNLPFKYSKLIVQCPVSRKVCSMHVSQRLKTFLHYCIIAIYR